MSYSPLSVVAAICFASVTFTAGQTPQGQAVNPSITAPAPTAKTPSGCLDEVAGFAAAQQKNLPPPGDPSVMQQRNARLQEINTARLAMTKACTAQFDPATIELSQLAPAIQLFSDAGLNDQLQATVDRALSMVKVPADRAAIIVTAISGMRRVRPSGSDRPWRVATLYPKIEALVDELDANPGATFAQKWSVHTSMEGTYRGDDIDGGIIKHGNWVINAAKLFSPDERQRLGPYVVAAHVDMAEAYAGQNMTDKGIALLREAKTNWGDLPATEGSVAPELARYELVGTPGKAIVARVWLNAPVGTGPLPMVGAVTLLEFTAHWCGPCRESYPGINRLRARFADRDFRVVMVTRLWGYFGTERNVSADAEIADDKAYFAGYHLDVPVAIGEARPVTFTSGQVQYLNGQDPNDTAYRVNGIPQIQLIDKKGTIRLIMIGYDNTNESKLGGLIESLLNEK